MILPRTTRLQCVGGGLSVDVGKKEGRNNNRIRSGKESELRPCGQEGQEGREMQQESCNLGEYSCTRRYVQLLNELGSFILSRL